MNKSTKKTTLLSVLLGSTFLSILLPITLLSNDKNITLNENTSSILELTDISKVEKIFTKADADLLIASKGLNWDGNLVANDFNDYGSISENAFSHNKKITSLILSNTIKTIGLFAFYNAINLTSIDLPGVTGVGVGAFIATTSLTSINLPAATSIGFNAFTGATSLKYIDLPSVISVGAGTFTGATSLKSINLPVATIIGQSAFIGTKAIIKLTCSAEINNTKATYWGTTIDKLKITNPIPTNYNNLGIIIGVSVSILLLTGTIVGGVFLIYRKKAQGSIESKIEK